MDRILGVKILVDRMIMMMMKIWAIICYRLTLMGAIRTRRMIRKPMKMILIWNLR